MAYAVTVSPDAPEFLAALCRQSAARSPKPPTQLGRGRPAIGVVEESRRERKYDRCLSARWRANRSGAAVSRRASLHPTASLVLLPAPTGTLGVATNLRGQNGRWACCVDEVVRPNAPPHGAGSGQRSDRPLPPQEHRWTVPPRFLPYSALSMSRSPRHSGRAARTASGWSCIHLATLSRSVPALP